MLLTNVLTLSLFVLSSASSSEVRDDDQCRIVTETYTGAACWVPSPEALPSTSAKPEHGTVSGEKPDASFNEVLGKSGSGKSSTTPLPSRPDGGSNSYNAGKQYSHPNSGALPNSTRSHAGQPQGATRLALSSTARQTSTSKHEWEDWVLAGTPFSRPSFISTKPPVGGKPSNRTATPSRLTSGSAFHERCSQR